MMYRNYSLITSFFLCFTADTAASEIKNCSTVWRRAGDNVILPCKYSPRSNQTGYLDIEWTIRNANNKESYKMILTLSGGKVYPRQQRISFASENGSEGDASLYFESLVVADSGIYECKVKVEGRIHQITWSLTVQDNQNATQSASATSNIPVSQYNTTQLPSVNSTISSQHTPTDSSLNTIASIVIGVCGFIILLILLVIYLKLKMKAVRLHRTAVNTTEQLEDFLSQDNLQCSTVQLRDQDIIYSTVQTVKHDTIYSTVQACNQGIIYSTVQKHNTVQNYNESVTYTPVQKLNTTPLPNTVIKQNPDLVYTKLKKP